MPFDLFQSIQRSIGLARRSHAAHDHLISSLVFLAGRAALYAAGLPFKLDMLWMFLADPADLRDRLLETVYYFHAYPPGMNVLTGILLKLSDQDPTPLAHGVFVLSGLVLINSMLYMARALGLSRLVSFGLCTVFSLIPPSFYLENLYIYDYPAAALICLAAALFHRAITRAAFRTWFLFFFVCAVLAWLRSSYHFVWYVALVGLAVCAAKHRARASRRVALAALAPLCLLLALYLKNLFVFGVFGATSWAGANMIAVTTAHLPRELKSRWVQEGKLSPFAEISVFAEPNAYLPYFESSENPAWPQQLRVLKKPSVQEGNFNHWFFLEINRRRREDAMYYIRHLPLEYLGHVFGRGLPEFFGPTTLWHPYDDHPDAPHVAHRRMLGGYERAYNLLVHGFPNEWFGLYTFLPIALIWALFDARARLRKGGERSAAAAFLLIFCLFQIAYVAAISSLVTAGESARYRYLIEPFIWVVSASAVVRAVARGRKAMSQWRHIPALVTSGPSHARGPGCGNPGP